MPQLSIEEATYWQKLAFKQNSAKEVNLMLEKAISLYKQGKTDGWNQNEIDDAIKICEASKIGNGISERVAVAQKVEIVQPIAETPVTEVKPMTPPAPTPIVQVEHVEKKHIPQQSRIVNTRSKKMLPKREVATIK